MRQCQPWRRWRYLRLPLLGLLFGAGLALTACQPPESRATEVVTLPVVAAPTESPQEATPLPPTEPPPMPPTATPAPTTEAPPRTLTVCLAEEPSSLYVFGGPDQAWRHVQEALRDGPIDQRTYGYQAVILEKLPHWEDGDVQLEPVRVRPGEVLATTDGELVRLEGGVTYWTRDLVERVAGADETITTVQMVVTFRLRPDVRWSDGEPLTATDSVFGFQVLQSEDTSIPNKYLIRRTAGYEARDEQTVAWTGVPGYLDSTYFLNFMDPLPAHAYGHMTAAELGADEQVNRQPLGWGAFRVAEWVAGYYIRLVPNEHYYRADEGLPYLDELRFVFAAEEGDALARVLAGECEIAVRDEWSAWEGQGEAILAAEAAGQLAPQFVPGPLLEHLDFGIAPDGDYFRKAGRDLFLSTEVRRAVAYCLDRQALANEVQWGRGVVADSYVPPNHPMFTDTVRTYAYDPAQGGALLAEAGWEDSNGDGIRDRAGASLVLQYAVNYPGSYTGELRRVVAEQIQAGLRSSCGIELEVQPLSGVEMYSEWPVSVVFGRKFDLAQFAWLLPGDPRCDLYTTAEIPREGYVLGANAAGYSRPEFDAACEQALTARTRDQALAAHTTAQQHFAEDLPSLPLFFRLRVGVARPEVIGYELDPTHPSPLWNVEAFDVALDE